MKNKSARDLRRQDATNRKEKAQADQMSAAIMGKMVNNSLRNLTHEQRQNMVNNAFPLGKYT